MKQLIKEYNSGVAWFAVVAATCFSLLGLLLPPMGIISPSAMILTAQFLVFSAGVLFGSATAIKQIAHITDIIKDIQDNVKK